MGEAVLSIVRFLLIFFALAIFAIAGSEFYAGRFDGTPKTQTFLDRSGRVIGTLNPVFGGFQIWTDLEKIPQTIVDETIRREDRFFHWHLGINPVSVIKSASANLSRGRIVRGGSTITQQLARTVVQEKEGKKVARSYVNKIREGLIAIGLEIRHSKKWILERYLNSIYYGNRCYGIAAAGEFYFGKRLKELTDGEVAFLVSRPRAPSRLHPPSGSLPSREGGSLQFPSPLRGEGQGEGGATARHFLHMAARENRGEQVVQTTLDLGLQGKAEAIVEKITSDWADRDEKINAAVVVLEVKSGDLLALVGSRNFLDDIIDGQYNSAMALRQPGSTLKPFVYFAAFAKGYRPDTHVFDVPSSFASLVNEEADGYMPQNFDRRFHGAITIREALANSYNVPAVTTLDTVGLSTYHEILRRFGFRSLRKSPDHYGLAVALGAGEVTLLELTNAYAALARGGRFVPYRALLSSHRPVTSDQGPEDIVSMSGGPDVMVSDSSTSKHPDIQTIPNAFLYASMVTDILADPEARLKSFGSNEDLVIDGHEVAVKTGTSYERRDHWTVGYTPRYAVGVWIGHPDASKLPSDKNIAATPIWHAVMEQLLRGEKPIPFFRQDLADVKKAPPDRKFLSKSEVGWQIVSPLGQTRFRKSPLVPMEHQRISAEVSLRFGEFLPDLKWYLDGRLIEATSATASWKVRVWLSPEDGWHKLAVESDEGARQVVSFHVSSEAS